MRKLLFIYTILIAFTILPQAVFSSTQLSVPFTSQAPDGVWIQPWQDACEETSVYMVDRFYKNKSILNPVDAKKGILEIFSMKHQRHGESLDETASNIANIINAYLPWSARVVENPSIHALKSEIDNGRPVIVPFFAPALHNPHFTSDFPYHMGVISGYDDAKNVFILQEPGTMYGKDFMYTYDTVMNAMHDFIYGNVSTGPKRVVFTNPKSGDTIDIDADNDGLTKKEEFKHGTIPYYYDSDGDGFGDGIEIKYGYMPTKNEQAIIKNNALLISPSSPNVYVMHNGVKRHVTSEKVFYSHGWNWDMLESVSDAMMKTIPEGSPLT
jgi:hypothetical protein